MDASPINSLSTLNTGKDKPHSLSDLDSDQFLQLMITELSNQDPLNPMDNEQLAQQISTIRQISATSQLSDSLNGVQSGQSLTTASSLIGKYVTALDDQSNEVSGLVDRISIDVDEKSSQRTYRVHVGDSDIDLKNIRGVTESPPAADPADPEDPAELPAAAA
jgi:flagellar basal-body rod modification protein FlgD